MLRRPWQWETGNHRLGITGIHPGSEILWQNKTRQDFEPDGQNNQILPAFHQSFFTFHCPVTVKRIILFSHRVFDFPGFLRNRQRRQIFLKNAADNLGFGSARGGRVIGNPGQNRIRQPHVDMAAGFAGRRPAHGGLSGLSFFHWKAHWVDCERHVNILGFASTCRNTHFLRVFGMAEKSLEFVLTRLHVAD